MKKDTPLDTREGWRMTMGREPGLLTARDGYVLEKLLHDRPPLTDDMRRV